MAAMGERVTLWMDAPVDAVWELVSDVTRIGEFSPETFEAEWTGGATGPAKDATFRGHVKRNGVGPVYWAPCKVTVCDPPRTFEFTVLAGRRVNNWGYELVEKDGGTEVSEYFRLEQSLPMRIYWFALGRWRGRTNVRGMQTTLERMKAVVEGMPL